MQIFRTLMVVKFMKIVSLKIRFLIKERHLSMSHAKSKMWLLQSLFSVTQRIQPGLIASKLIEIMSGIYEPNLKCKPNQSSNSNSTSALYVSVSSDLINLKIFEEEIKAFMLLLIMATPMCQQIFCLWDVTCQGICIFEFTELVLK